jgi:DNA repair exonuclease SbcCD nuclease subunit
MVEYAKEHKPDLIIHAGDLFEKNILINSPEFRSAVDCMIALANVAPVFMCRGNHDPDKSLEIFQKLKTKHTIRYSDKVEILPEKKARILSIPYIKPSLIGSGERIGDINISGAESLRNYIDDFIESDKDPNTFNFVVGHFTVIGAELANSERILEGEIMLSVEDLDKDALDGVFLGHIHKADQDMFEGTNIRYSGAHYRTRFDEMGEPGFRFWKFDDKGNVDIKFVETPARDMMQFEFDEDETKKIIKSGKLPVDILEDSDVKVVFNVPEGMRSSLDLDKLKELCPDSSTLKTAIRTIPKVSVRSAEMSKAKSDIEKLEEWARVTGTKITDGIRKKMNIILEVVSE